MISDTQHFGCRACPFSFGTQYQFPDGFYIRGPAHPLRFRFIHQPTLPSLHTHTPPAGKRSLSVLLLHPALDFLFSPSVFFFFFNDQPFIPADRHAVRESFLHTHQQPHTPPSKHPSHLPLLYHTPHSVTPFLLVPAYAAASSLGEYQRSSCPGVSNEGQRDKPQALHVLEEYCFVSSYAIVVCPRTPYRDDVLAP